MSHIVVHFQHVLPNPGFLAESARKVDWRELAALGVGNFAAWMRLPCSISFSNFLKIDNSGPLAQADGVPLSLYRTMKHLKIGQRLALGFGIVVVLMVAYWPPA